MFMGSPLVRALQQHHGPDTRALRVDLELELLAAIHRDLGSEPLLGHALNSLAADPALPSEDFVANDLLVLVELASYVVTSCSCTFRPALTVKASSIRRSSQADPRWSVTQQLRVLLGYLLAAKSKRTLRLAGARIFPAAGKTRLCCSKMDSLSLTSTPSRAAMTWSMWAAPSMRPSCGRVLVEVHVQP
ncbi:hypothetical protein ON010_g5874 [Phytophthora cinnamomi]|nr:hypothetical protein ON010_g5874 [Phytophthora cinnamomi]